MEFYSGTKQHWLDNINSRFHKKYNYINEHKNNACVKRLKDDSNTEIYVSHHATFTSLFFAVVCHECPVVCHECPVVRSKKCMLHVFWSLLSI